MFILYEISKLNICLKAFKYHMTVTSLVAVVAPRTDKIIKNGPVFFYTRCI